ncbi:MAG: hypothetical protein JW953_17135 [Anaerolineae bacterium]|nr:hypothetical protein [Anaerolineae bacterium]
MSVDHAQAEISVVDDGIGFDPAQPLPDEEQHFGSRIMRERAAEIGAQLNVQSAPGQGTRVTVRVPRSS